MNTLRIGLGGFTTFSTAALHSVEIRQPRNGGIYALAMLIGAVVSAAIGMAVGNVNPVDIRVRGAQV